MVQLYQPGRQSDAVAADLRDRRTFTVALNRARSGVPRLLQRGTVFYGRRSPGHDCDARPGRQSAMDDGASPGLAGGSVALSRIPLYLCDCYSV
jgi:hypothetical protein